MLKYDIDYYSLLCKGLKNLNLSDGRYKIYYSYSFPMLIKEQTKDVLYGAFVIKNKELIHLTFEPEIEKYSNIQEISKFILIEDTRKKIIIEKVDDKLYYLYFNEDMDLARKEDKNDEVDKFNKENHNYFNCSEFLYSDLSNKMKEHIKNCRLNLLSTFIPK